jgi:hypothetical protein
VSSLRKIAVFIDGPNLYGAARTLGFELDFRLLLKEIPEPGNAGASVLLHNDR